MNIRYLSLLAAGLAFILAACDPGVSANDRERIATQQLTNQAAVTLGLPAIKNFTEKRQLKAIYELRDQANLVTWTYTVDMNGKRHKVCPSTSNGFGIPYSTQYTNPQAVQRWYLPQQGNLPYAYGDTTLAQPDPNALFSPQSSDATWVLCLNPNTKELSPTYVEPRIEVYLFEMPSVD